MAIDGVLSHFQRSNIKTISVITNPLLLVNPADLMSEFKFSFFQRETAAKTKIREDPCCCSLSCAV